MIELTSLKTAHSASCRRLLSSIITVVALIFISFTCASAKEIHGIPKGYEVGDHTTSPDGRFAVLFPVYDSTNPTEGTLPSNLLVRLKPYSVVATVLKDGLPLNATGSLEASWSGNSLVGIYLFRKWGILNLWVYELEGDKVKYVHPIGDEARKIFEKDFRGRFLKKYPKEKGSFVFVSDEGEENPRKDFEFKGRTVLLHLFADNKPNLAGGPHWSPELRAVWNLDTRKFEKVDFNPGEISVRPNP